MRVSLRNNMFIFCANETNNAVIQKHTYGNNKVLFTCIDSASANQNWLSDWKSFEIIIIGSTITWTITGFQDDKCRNKAKCII